MNLYILFQISSLILHVLKISNFLKIFQIQKENHTLENLDLIE